MKAGQTALLVGFFFFFWIGGAHAKESGASLETPPGITGEQAEAPHPKVETVSAPSTPSQAKERLKTAVSISFTNADLRNVLSGLAKTYGLNIVVDEKVRGAVNINLTEVVLEEALQQILRLNGYTFIWEGSILKVVDLKEEVVTRVIPLNFVQADIAMEFLRQKSSESGVLKADEVQGGMLVTDTISNVEEMQKVLKQIDIPPQQVLIQARLLDITHTDQDNLGLKLSSVGFDIPLRGSFGTDNLLQIASGALDLGGPSSDLTTDTLSATISKGSETLTATIDALIRNKRVKVLASPTIGTLNNVEAKITIGEKFPIQETTQTTTGTLQTTRFVDVGITLRVTPKINRAGYIQMQIHPEVSSVSSTIDAGPRITTREADTTIIIRDRESVIIAGLIKEEETMTRDRIPILGHIPWLGLLFSNRAKSYEQKELMIVITPYLIPVDGPQKVADSEVQQMEHRVGAVELYRAASDFEMGKSLQARDLPRPVRLYQAAEMYEKMADQYPRHPLTPEALWRGGSLSWDQLQNAALAERLFLRLSAEYPRHLLARRAEGRVGELKKHLERQQRKSEKEAKRYSTRKNPASRAAQETSVVPFGFR